MCACASFPFGFEAGAWDLIVLVPDHRFAFYNKRTENGMNFLRRVVKWTSSLFKNRLANGSDGDNVALNVNTQG